MKSGIVMPCGVRFLYVDCFFRTHRFSLNQDFYAFSFKQKRVAGFALLLLTTGTLLSVSENGRLRFLDAKK